MSNTHNALVLKQAPATLYQQCPDIQKEYGGFRTAHIDNSFSPKSFYIVYDKVDYGKAYFGNAKTQFVPSNNIMSGSSEPVSLGFDAASAQGFDCREPGIILFQHFNYNGFGKEFRETTNDISASFPPNSPSGVSSVIVTGGTWGIYDGKNGEGTLLATIKNGEMNPKLDSNDKAMSIILQK